MPVAIIWNRAQPMRPRLTASLPVLALALTAGCSPTPTTTVAQTPQVSVVRAKAQVLALTRDLVARTGCGFLMVTHSARLAATLDRHVNLSAGLIA